MDLHRDPEGRILTYHLVRERPGRQPVVAMRMITDRWRLRRVPGLHVAKVLGTGRGADTGPSSDLRRQAYLLVWDGPGSARTFFEQHRLPERWRRAEVEQEGALGLVGGHGRWSGRTVLDGMRRVDPGDGPVVVLTRARVRLRSWWAFRSASRATRRVVDAPGVDWVVGVGELPVAFVGTLSRWTSMDAVDRFATADQDHAAAARHGDSWFAESLFARFAPIEFDVVGDRPGTLSSTGTG
ncbi:MAG: monooxygenase [Ilumatobacteraceae bacterium]